jgi:hypothetical protein
MTEKETAEEKRSQLIRELIGLRKEVMSLLGRPHRGNAWFGEYNFVPDHLSRMTDTELYEKLETFKGLVKRLDGCEECILEPTPELSHDNQAIGKKVVVWCWICGCIISRPPKPYDENDEFEWHEDVCCDCKRAWDY